MSPIFVGIDVSKKTLDVAFFPEERHCRFDNTDVGREALAAELAPLQPQLVAAEATGGYERPMALRLMSEGISVAVVNPSQVRHFAKGLGRKAKNDRIDAKVIAQFAQISAPAPLTKTGQHQMELAELVSVRAQLVAMRTALKNQIAQAGSAVRHLQAVSDACEEEIRDVEEKIEQLLARSKELGARRKRLATMKGVGLRTSTILTARLPELGVLDRQEIAALAGLAPFTRESGQWKGRSWCSGGRKDIKHALFMAAMSARRHSPPIKAFYNRLRESGKPKMVALVACMRKMLVWLNAMVRDNLDWEDLNVMKPACAGEGRT